MSGYPEDRPEASRASDSNVIEQARAAVLPPAMLLIFNGFFGLVLLGLLSVPMVFQPEQMVDFFDKLVAQQPPGPEKQEAEQKLADARQHLKDHRDEVVQQDAMILAIPGIVNLLSIIGGISMRRLSSYGLSIAGSIAALIPFGTGCCVTGIPFGIWGLVVLTRPEVKTGFVARRTAAPPDPDAQYLS